MNELDDTLEALIDAHDLQTVLNSIVRVCGEKADHLRTNWQDRQSARVWEDAGVKVMNVADTLNI